jgi:hypothetical protein
VGALIYLATIVEIHRQNRMVKKHFASRQPKEQA